MCLGLFNRGVVVSFFLHCLEMGFMVFVREFVIKRFLHIGLVLGISWLLLLLLLFPPVKFVFVTCLVEFFLHVFVVGIFVVHGFCMFLMFLFGQ